MPPRDKYKYTFDNLAKTIDEFTTVLGLSKFALYVQDYGAPVGYRLAVAHPERISAIVVQNGNAYDEGLDNDFWKPLKAYWKEPNNLARRDALRPFLKYDATKWQYTNGVKQLELISPDGLRTISSCSGERGTKRSSSTCSSVTAAISCSTRNGRLTSASTSRRY